jgi:D-alanyl-D-alanine carboxypeptidase/D-alanyl-D-alanine-endopeptidase (penicillin-binding protein 4)
LFDYRGLPMLRHRPLGLSSESLGPIVPRRTPGRGPAVGATIAATAAAAATFLAGTAAAPAAEGDDRSLTHKLARALAVPQLARARSAALAVDLATGRVVFARNVGVPLAPASTEKLAVAYAALAAFGPSYRVRTEVLGEGELAGTTWDGDLVLKGYGDPTLSTYDLRLLAGQVRAAGIRRVSGRVRGDETFFDARRTAPGWRPSFFIDESPPLSALVVDRGRYRGIVSRQPALAAAAAFHASLAAAGVAVARSAEIGRATEDAVPLATVLSPPLAAIVRYMTLESDNFTAELLLKQLGALEAVPGTTTRGAAAVRTLLATDGIPLAGVRLADGSGLSLLNRLTARSLVAILRAAWLDPAVRRWLVAALPVAGIRGTLEDRLRRPPARGIVFAKTGTTRLASSLAGYVKGRFVFALIQNGRPVPYWSARRAQDRFVTALAAAQ